MPGSSALLAVALLRDARAISSAKNGLPPARSATAPPSRRRVRQQRRDELARLVRAERVEEDDVAPRRPPPQAGRCSSSSSRARQRQERPAHPLREVLDQVELRGFALLARCAGLLGQLAEERRHPVGMQIYREVDSHAVYVRPEEQED